MLVNSGYQMIWVYANINYIVFAYGAEKKSIKISKNNTSVSWKLETKLLNVIFDCT